MSSSCFFASSVKHSHHELMCPWSISRNCAYGMEVGTGYGVVTASKLTGITASSGSASSLKGTRNSRIGAVWDWLKLVAMANVRRPQAWKSPNMAPIY